MNLEKTAKEIVDVLGGSDNIVHLTHCMTRLRFNLKDESKADLEALKTVEGVMGVATGGGVLQVIVGTDVDRVYKEISDKYVKIDEEASPLTEEEKKNPVMKALDLFSATLSPLIPAIMGAGFISIVLALLNQLHILTPDSTTYTLLNNISNCVYYFFPVLIASARISSNRSSSASSVIFCIMKFTLASFTPSIFLMASSTFAAQLAQSISHLNFFFMAYPFRYSYSSMCSLPMAIIVLT